MKTKTVTDVLFAVLAVCIAVMTLTAQIVTVFGVVPKAELTVAEVSGVVDPTDDRATESAISCEKVTKYVASDFQYVTAMSEYFNSFGTANLTNLPDGNPHYKSKKS